MKKCLMLVFGLICILLMSSCDSYVKTEVVATIAEVRVSTSNSYVEKSTVGDLVASIASDSNTISKRIVEQENTKCQVIAKTEDGVNLRWFLHDDEARTASTFKSGDRIKLTKYTKGTEDITYWWVSFSKNAEIIP